MKWHPTSQPERAGSDSGIERPIGLLKILIGMALEGYKFGPKAGRSTVPKEIADDLAKQGIAMDVDTVRKWLKQAAELLPGE